MKPKIYSLILLFLTSCAVTKLSENDYNNKKILKISDKCEIIGGMEELVEQIKDKRIIYIGESHDQYSHHQTQLEIIKELSKRGIKIAIGMEMFQSKFQYVIDDYLNGQIDENDFLTETDYKKRWGFDYQLYRPIIEFAKKEKIPILALNIESEIIKKISKIGISSLSSAELNKLPFQLDFTDKKYKNFIYEIFKVHPKQSEMSFERFYNIQVIWDESMAEVINTFLEQHRNYHIVVLAGNGHIIFTYGIPQRTYRRNKLEFTTIVNDLEHDNGIADYVIYSKQTNYHHNKQLDPNIKK